jgi:hypothetical protein
VAGRGRGLLASRRLQPGELVLRLGAGPTRHCRFPREKPLLTVTTPHTPGTIAKFVGELRKKVNSGHSMVADLARCGRWRRASRTSSSS